MINESANSANTHNHSRKLITVSLRVIASGIIAFVILSLGCLIYFNVPAHYADTDGVTSFIFPPNTFHAQAQEGFCYGTTNNEGYKKNLRDYHKGDKIDLLIMGTSHMEAEQLFVQDAAPAILESLSGMIVYNVGIPGETFAMCLSNLKAAVKKYHPSRYIVLEVFNPVLTNDELMSINTNSVEGQPAHDKGLVALLRRASYLRLMYHKYVKNWFSDAPDNGSIQYPDYALLSGTMKRIAETVDTCGAKLIIAYHPVTSLSKDGSLNLESDSGCLNMLSSVCRENGIYFLDVGARFLKEYGENHVIPYGFANTSVGNGHLNKYGHKIFAEEIYSLIQAIERKRG